MFSRRQIPSPQKNLGKLARYLLLSAFAWLQICSLQAQQGLVDSLMQLIKTDEPGPAKAAHLLIYAWAIEGLDSEGARTAAREAYQIALDLDHDTGKVISLKSLGYFEMSLGNYENSLTNFYEAQHVLDDFSLPSNAGTESFYHQIYGEEISKDIEVADVGRFIGHLHGEIGNYSEQLIQYKKAYKIFQEAGHEELIANTVWNIGDAYNKLGQPDSALIYAVQGLEYYQRPDVPLYIKTYLGGIYNIIGLAYLKKGNLGQAEVNFLTSEKTNLQFKNDRDLCTSQLYLAELYLDKEDHSNSLTYANKALRTAEALNVDKLIVTSYRRLSDSHQALNQFDSSHHYLQLAAPLMDSVNLNQKNNLIRFQYALLKQNNDLQERQRQEDQAQTRNRMIGLFVILGLLGSLALLLFRNNRSKQKSNALLSEQKSQLQNALVTLKSTQSQLIHSEKMASLGELTAGIAHEIQNPLNFVNNFSDVSGEMIDEAIQELENGETAETKEILSDLKGNLAKINHHGDRASSIVKGMLAHSRSSSEEKELTDINALCHEYLRLSYHGLRAKDKSFNADFDLQLEESLPKFSGIPQDLGRVLLNVINNAFYTVDKKRKSNIEEDHKPKVSISTKAVTDKIEIRIQDNGQGMSTEVMDKIFQPFFTTKPTGSGTGLGMSISYDIITKGHGGTFEVESTPGIGTTFTIRLPVV